MNTLLPLVEFSKGDANQTFPFLNFSPFGGGVGGGAGKKCKEMFGFARASPRARPRCSPAQSGRTQEVQATTHAERAKWVRAKVTMSPQIETSKSERVDARRDADAACDNSARREAAYWLGGGNPKCGDLSLVSIQKLI